MVGSTNSVYYADRIIYTYRSSLRFERAFCRGGGRNKQSYIGIDRGAIVANAMVVDLPTIRPPGHPPPFKQGVN